MKTLTLFTDTDLASRIYMALVPLDGFQGDAFALQGTATMVARRWFGLVPEAIPPMLSIVTSPEEDPPYWRQLLDSDLILILEADSGNGAYRLVYPVSRHHAWKVN